MSSLSSSILPTAPVNLNPGAGPLLALRRCSECRESHASPAFLTFTDVPPEVIENIVAGADNPLEINCMARLCSRFRALAIYVLYGRLCSVLQQFRFADGRRFLKVLRRNGIYWAGPHLLPTLFPGFHCASYENQLELHIHNNRDVQSSLTTFLCEAGYNLISTFEGPRRLEAFAAQDLGYPFFGHTLKRILCFTMRSNGVLKEVIVFVSKSEATGFLSITEYPTTLFMVYVDGININTLYPFLTGHRRGLINLPFPQPRASNANAPAFLGALSPFFDLKSRLTAWPEYIFHVCNQNPSCPLRLRHQLNNCGLSLGCTVDHPDMRVYCRRDPGRICPPAAYLVVQRPTLCIWRLRCCSSCLTNMPFPGQNLSHCGAYIARDMFVSDVGA